MAEKAAENPSLLLPTDHNYATNIQYKGGLPAFVKDNMEAYFILLKKISIFLDTIYGIKVEHQK